MLWCCCGVSTLTPINLGAASQDTSNPSYNPNYYNIGFPNPYPSDGLLFFQEYGPSSTDPGRLYQQGIAIEFAIGAVTSSTSSAILDFLGRSGSIYGIEPPVEPDQTLQYFVFDKSLITISGINVTDMGSYITDSQPSTPGWGYPGTTIYSPDLSSLVNTMLSEPSWNALTSQMVIVILSQNPDQYVNTASPAPDKMFRIVNYQEINIS